MLSNIPLILFNLTIKGFHKKKNSRIKKKRMTERKKKTGEVLYYLHGS